MEGYVVAYLLLSGIVRDFCYSVVVSVSCSSDFYFLAFGDSGSTAVFGFDFYIYVIVIGSSLRLAPRFLIGVMSFSLFYFSDTLINLGAVWTVFAVLSNPWLYLDCFCYADKF